MLGKDSLAFSWPHKWRAIVSEPCFYCEIFYLASENWDCWECFAHKHAELFTLTLYLPFYLHLSLSLSLRKDKAFGLFSCRNFELLIPSSPCGYCRDRWLLLHSERQNEVS